MPSIHETSDDVAIVPFEHNLAGFAYKGFAFGAWLKRLHKRGSFGFAHSVAACVALAQQGTGCNHHLVAACDSRD